MSDPTTTCVWGDCNAPVHSSRLCVVHRFQWVPERYLHGAEVTDQRINSGGRVEWEIDGFWHAAHRLIMTRHLGRHLEHDEVIVHRDGNFENNDLENLLLTDKSTAMKLARERGPRQKLVKRRARISIELRIKMDHDIDQTVREQLEMDMNEWLENQLENMDDVKDATWTIKVR